MEALSCYLSFSGHSNGAIQMWDLTTALDFFNKNEKSDYPNQQTGNKLGIHSDQGGPTTQELVMTSELKYQFSIIMIWNNQINFTT